MVTLYSRVFDILHDSPETRSNDRILTERVYMSMGVDVHAPWYKINSNKKLPSLESIGRCRRKVQELHPDLSANENVAETRGARQEDFKDIAREKSSFVLGNEPFAFDWAT